MRGLYSSKTEIKTQNIHGRLPVWHTKSNLPEEVLEELPYKIIPGEVATYRDSIFLERAVVGERLRVAMGMSLRKITEHAPISKGVEPSIIEEKYYEPPLINVIKFACNACPEKRVMTTEGCQGCLEHPCVEVCPKKAVHMEGGRSHIDESSCIKCGKCVEACPYNAIIKQERPCTKACRNECDWFDEYGRAEIDQEKCVSCGQCLVSCPFSAIVDKGQIFQTIMAIKSETPVYAILAAGDRRSVPGYEKYKDPWRFSGTGIYRCKRSCDRSGSVYGGRSKGFSGRSSGETAVHGNILLPVLVYDGEKTVPGTGKMHFHGADTDGSDCATDQTERTGLQDRLCWSVCSRKNWRQAGRVSAVMWILY